MNIRLKINLKETKRTTVNIKKNKGLFSEKINKIDKFLVESTRKKKD